MREIGAARAQAETAERVQHRDEALLGHLELHGRGRRVLPAVVAGVADEAVHRVDLPFDFGDFNLFLIEVTSARLVAGFAQAATVAAEEFARVVADD